MVGLLVGVYDGPEGTSEVTPLGLNAGSRLGVNEVGMEVGCMVGLVLGASLGTREVGPIVETADGERLGLTLGPALGVYVGLVGLDVGVYDGPEGARDGTPLGLKLGSMLGVDDVGKVVGCGVGLILGKSLGIKEVGPIVGTVDGERLLGSALGVQVGSALGV